MNIPYAIDMETQVTIKADRAAVGAGKGRYLCGGCERHVHVVQKSKYNRVHFKHYPNEAIGCNYGKSQDLHTKAKECVADVFENALKHCEPMPLMQFETSSGVILMCPFIAGQVVKREFHLKGAKRRPDVAILDGGGNLVLAIEIKYKNGVNKTKMKDFANCFWIEVDATDVIEDCNVLKIKTHGNLPHKFNVPGQQNVLFLT
ncbi:MAG: hypothetical protein CTY37_04705 [Methylotenera sp.]|nr:MAG: hypothetical protein CTY37_04705 [Methylotenera sp.]